VKPEGRVIMMERSKSLYGPWEIRQLNHVDQKLDREPNQGGLIQLKNGQWWFFTHHGSGDWEGRPASLLPVHWMEGWPIIGEIGPETIGRMVWTAQKPIILQKQKIKIQTDDDFNSKTLLPQWEWNYQPRADKWSLHDHKGFLRLYAFKPINPNEHKKILLRAGNTITQRSMRTKANIVTVKIDINGMADGQYAGLTHFSTTSYSSLGIKQGNGTRKLVYNSNDADSVGIQIVGNFIWLQSSWDYQGDNRYGYSLDGKKFVPFGGTTQLTWGSYRGDRVGIFNFNSKDEKGYVDVDFFRYRYSK
jgi:beta-xylosidase